MFCESSVSFVSSVSCVSVLVSCFSFESLCLVSVACPVCQLMCLHLVCQLMCPVCLVCVLCLVSVDVSCAKTGGSKSVACHLKIWAVAVSLIS